MLKKTFLFYLLIISCAGLYAQGMTEVYGKVLDAKTKEPIEYVNIRFIGSLKATFSTPKGEYLIKTIEKTDSISFSYLGYKTRTIAIKRGKQQELNIEMGTSDVELSEITVKAGKRRKREIDTAANFVFHKVVENKAHNRAEGINTYKYESYEKLQIALFNPTKKLTNFPLFRPFGFAFLNKDTTADGDIFIPGVVKETLCDVYYRRKPRSFKKVVRGEVMTGIDNESVYNMANVQFKELDLYDNSIFIATKAFIAPFANAGLSFYYYYLTDTAKFDGRTTYKLHFVGKVKEDVALKGFAWIDSATWAIRSINVRPNEKANLNFVNSHNVNQEFTLINNKYWMLSREEMNSVGAILKRKGKLKILITKVLDRRNFVVDSLLPDSIFKGFEERVLEDSARKRSSAFWDSTRFEELTPQERKVFWISDTIKTVPSWKAWMWAGKFFTSAFAQAGPIDFGRILNMASRNNVEGWRLRFGFKTNQSFRNHTPFNDFLRRFYFLGYVAYGLKDRDFKHQALTRVGLPRKNDRWQVLEFLFRYDMRVPGQDENLTVLSFDNMATLVSGKILNKIMKVREFRVTYEKEWVKNFSTIMSFNEKTYFAIPGVFDFIRRDHGELRPLANFNVSEFTFDTRYAYKDIYFASNLFRTFQSTKYPVFMLRYTVGIADLHGEYLNYHNLLFTYKQKLQTSFGYARIALTAGKIFGRAPYTACYITQGNVGILLDKFNYNLLREFEFITDQYASLWIEHHFDGFFLNKIPGINKLRLREVLVFKSLIGSFRQNNNEILEVPHELSSPNRIPYIEVGFGIENIVDMFRVDVLWRATYRNTRGGQVWGVKLAFQPNF